MHPIVAADLRRDIKRLARDIERNERGLRRIEKWLQREQAIAVQEPTPETRDRIETAEVAINVLPEIVYSRRIKLLAI